jgi:hypothetical protein
VGLTARLDFWRSELNCVASSSPQPSHSAIPIPVYRVQIKIRCVFLRAMCRLILVTRKHILCPSCEEQSNHSHFASYNSVELYNLSN